MRVRFPASILPLSLNLRLIEATLNLPSLSLRLDGGGGGNRPFIGRTVLSSLFVFMNRLRRRFKNIHSPIKPGERNPFSKLIQDAPSVAGIEKDGARSQQSAFQALSAASLHENNNKCLKAVISDDFAS